MDRRGDLNAYEVALLGEQEALKRLDLLAAISRILDRTLDDYERALIQVTEACVPEFADLCAVEVIGPAGEVRPVASQATSAPGLLIPDTWTPIGRACAPDRKAVLSYPGSGERPALRDVREQLGAQSMIVCPITGGGITLGWFVAANSWSRRGFRPSALRIGVEVASRLGAAIQRVLLHREMQAVAREQSRAVRRLRRLATAATNLAGAATSEEVLRVACVEACVIQEADGAIARWWMADGTEVTAHGGEVDWPLAEVALAAVSNRRPARGTGWIAHPLPSTDPWQHAALVVFVQNELSADEELVLASLTSLIPVAFERAVGTEAVVLHEARLRAVIEASPVALVGVQPDGVVTLANRAAIELFGWVGESPELAQGGLLHPAITELVKAVMDSGAVVNETISVGDLDLSVSGAPLPATGSGPDELPTVLVAGVDLTEIHRAERALVQAQRLEAMGLVAGRVAHDFNNLLTLIIGYAELLARGVTDDHDRRLISDIEGAAKRAAALTQQMLGMTRRSDTDEVIDVTAELVGLHTVLNRLCGPRVTLSTSHPTVPARVRMPSSELEQLVINLVVNACDAMEGSGSISVAASLAPGAPLRGRAGRSRRPRLDQGHTVPGVILSVSDDGPGMEPEVLARCLEPFFTTKKRGAGSGLGLSTVYGLVQERGGELTVDSRLGEGTTVTLWLPLTEVATAKPVDEDPAERWAPGKTIDARVLFVEDDDDLRQMGEECLTSIGCRVVTAASAEEAMTKLALGGPFDALVTDIMLPGMSGIELAHAARTNQPRLPVLFMTGYTGTLPVDAQPAEGSPLLRKPYRPDDLRLRVASLVEAAALQRQS